jgi:hypothetical protein
MRAFFIEPELYTDCEVDHGPAKPVRGELGALSAVLFLRWYPGLAFLCNVRLQPDREPRSVSTLQRGIPWT